MTWRPEQQPACAQCGSALDASPSDDFCSDGCQMAWHSKGANHAIVRPRLQRPSPAPHVPPATWPTMPIPHPAGGITYARSREEYQRYLEDTAPVEEPPYPSDTAWTPEQERTFTGNIPGRGTQLTAISTPDGPGGFIRRILNATNRKATK